MLCRYSSNIQVPLHSASRKLDIPSFTATNNLPLSNSDKCLKTRTVFTPIILYSATGFNMTYTFMINFQDVLLQEGIESGPHYDAMKTFIALQKSSIAQSHKM